jgi:hypothetical protein
MAFVKVVEDSEIYNFPILHLVHFSSIFERKMSSKSPRLKHSRARARQRRAAPPRRPCRPRLSEVAHLPQVPAPRDTLESACHAPPRRSRAYAHRAPSGPPVRSRFPPPCAPYHDSIFIVDVMSPQTTYLSAARPPRVCATPIAAPARSTTSPCPPTPSYLSYHLSWSCDTLDASPRTHRYSSCCLLSRPGCPRRRSRAAAAAAPPRRSPFHSVSSHETSLGEHPVAARPFLADLHSRPRRNFG